MALGDLNGDGYLDLVVANAGQVNKACLGDGGGFFGECGAVSADVMDSRGVALGDVNGDGRLDAVFADYAQKNRVCMGNGDGTFGSCGDVSADEFNSYRVALAKINADNHLDAVFANSDGDYSRVCLGNGDGTFACSNVDGVGFSSNYKSRDVALGDLYKDDKMDAVFAVSYNYSPYYRNVVCLGDGSGGFSCTSLQTGSLSSIYEDDCYGVALGDLDGDNVLDVAFAKGISQYLIYWLGDGSGGFSRYYKSALYTEKQQDVALARDSDGKMYYYYADEPEVCEASPNPTNCREIVPYTSSASSVAVDFLIKKFTIIEPPANGTAVVNAGRTITYTPNSDFIGVDRFFYKMGYLTAAVKVNVGDMATASLTITGGGNGRVKSDPAGLDCNSDCQGLFVQGAQVTFSAVPNTGSAFDGWSIETCPGLVDCVLTLDENPYDITAWFRLDADNDGICDEVERSGPNDGDGNQDGLPDSGQANVTTFKNINNAWLTLEVGSGLSLVDVVYSNNTAASTPPDDQANPLGFLRFKIQGAAVGGQAAVKLIVHQPDDTLNSYYIYGPTPRDPTDHWYDFEPDGQTGVTVEQQDGRTVVVLNFLDGWTGDDDLTANGSISSYGAPSSVTGTTTGGGDSGGGGGCFAAELIREGDRHE